MLLVMRVLSIVPLNFKVGILILGDRMSLDDRLFPHLATTLVRTVVT